MARNSYCTDHSVVIDLRSPNSGLNLNPRTTTVQKFSGDLMDWGFHAVDLQLKRLLLELLREGQHHPWLVEAEPLSVVLLASQ